MKIGFLKFITSAVFTILVLCGYSQSVVEPMKPARLVNDFSNILSSEQQNQIEGMLRELNAKTSTQITVVTVDDLQGLDISQYTTELAHKWGIGQADKDNGIVVLVKPKNQTGKGEVFIAVGYGLEGVVPDAIAGEIIRNEVIPHFKKGKMFEGIYSATNILKGLVAKEFTADEYHQKESSGNLWGLKIMLFIMVIAVLINMKLSGRSVSMGHEGSRTASTVIPPIFMMGGRSSNSFGSFSGGSGSFGGFGGGGFGGGGAGGSW